MNSAVDYLLQAQNTKIAQGNAAQAAIRKYQIEQKVKESDIMLRAMESVNSTEDLPILERTLVGHLGPQSAQAVRQKIQSIFPYGYDPKQKKIITGMLYDEKEKIELMKMQMDREEKNMPKFSTPGQQQMVYDEKTGRYEKYGEQTPFKPNKPEKPEKDTTITLTQKALKGDKQAQNVLQEMLKQAEAKGQASAQGKLSALQNAIDIDGVAKTVIAGRETIENVKNTFGVPVQEIVRKAVLTKDPKFNFVQPRAVLSSLKSSLMQQQKNKGMMGSFVRNINKQVGKLEKISNDIVKRVGLRALDVPIRKLNTAFIGSGNEQVFNAYMKEISAEIAKLAQGSAASVAQLPEENRKEWEKIHDVNLSFKELLIVLNGTREMANFRLDSVTEEINATRSDLGNVRKGKKKKAVNNDPLGIR